MEWNENYAIGILTFGILVGLVGFLWYLFLGYKRLLLEKARLEAELAQKQEKIKAFSGELASQLEYEVAKRMRSDYLSEYLFENSLNPMMIAKVTEEEKIEVLKCNKSALDTFKYEGDLGFLGLFADFESQKYALDRIHKALQSKNRQNFKSMIKSESGKLPMIVSVHTFAYEGKLALCFTFVDISEVTKLEQELRDKRAMLTQKSKMEEMGKMLGNIAHQWKQPLNSLYLLCQNLKEMQQFGELDEERFEKYIKIMSEQIGFMSRTIDEFREFFRPSKGEERFEVYGAIKNILELFYKLVDKRITIQIAIDKKVSVFGSKNEFQQIMIVLLDNAIDAIRARLVRGEINKGEIGIFCNEIKDKACVLRIKDNGGGIAEEIGSKIFESYFTTKENGNGIGLAMVSMILEKIGGKITYKNCDDGVEFQMEVPFAGGGGGQITA